MIAAMKADVSPMSTVELDFSEGAPPLYRQVAQALIARITEGELSPGEALPPEDVLCKLFGVSRITVRKAVEELLARHLIVRRRGVGTFVSDPGRATKSVTLIGFIDEVLPHNQMQVLDEAMVPLPPRLRRFPGLGGGDWKRLRAVNHVKPGEPLDYVNFYFPERLGQAVSAASISGELPPIKHLERNLGIRIDHADQCIEPVAASAEAAARLGVSRGTPLLRGIRVYYDMSGRPVEIVDAVYHPERYLYTATLYPRAVRGA